MTPLLSPRHIHTFEDSEARLGGLFGSTQCYRLSGARESPATPKWRTTEGDWVDRKLYDKIKREGRVETKEENIKFNCISGLGWLG